MWPGQDSMLSKLSTRPAKGIHQGELQTAAKKVSYWLHKEGLHEQGHLGYGMSIGKQKLGGDVYRCRGGAEGKIARKVMGHQLLVKGIFPVEKKDSVRGIAGEQKYRLPARSMGKKI